VPIPVDGSKNMILGYHYALRQQAKQLAKEKVEIQKMKDLAIATSAAFHKARNDASYTNSKRHRRHGSRMENLKKGEASPKTSTRPSYQSMSKATSYQKY
jgi:hypothetical protein